MKPACPRLSALLSSALALGLCAGQATAAGTLRYTVAVDGDPRAGHHVVRQSGDGETRVSFAYMDRGRGTRLEERYTLAPDGTYLRYDAEGTTHGGPVDETYRRAPGETGLYLPEGGSPARLGVAITALAREPGGAVPLRGGGTLRAEVIGGLDLIRRGQRRTVDLLALTGLETVPVLAWATHGPEPRLFAHLGRDGVLVVEAGWESVADALQQRQRRAVAEEVRELEERTAHRPGGPLLVRGARVFDSERGVLGPPASVLVSDGRIVAVDAGGDAPRDAGAAQVVDADGLSLLPGLFAASDPDGWIAPLQLAHGVTTLHPDVRGAATGSTAGAGTGGMGTVVDRLARAVDAGAKPADVLRAATWGAAEAAGMLEARGSITPGKRADLVLVDGDPTTDIAALRRTALVLRDGALHYPAEIRRAYGLPHDTAPRRPAAPLPPKRSRLEPGKRELPGQFPG